MFSLSDRRSSLFALLLAVACSSGDVESRAAGPGSQVVGEPTLASVRDIGLRNARMPIVGLVTGGQPDEAQLDALIGAGFEHFISLRPTAEDGAGWEETTVGAPTVFARIPIRGGADLTRENVEELDHLLNEAGDGATVLYCASGNRVGALLALRAAWIDGVAPEDALTLGRAAGLTRLEGAVVQLLGLQGAG